MLTAISGMLLEKAEAKAKRVTDLNEIDKKEKSSLFKDAIKYNSLVATASKVQDHSITSSDIERLVG